MKSIAMTPVNTMNVFAIKATLIAERLGVAVAAKYLAARRVPVEQALKILASHGAAK